MRISHKSKRALAPLPQVAELIEKLLETPNDELPEVLGEIDTWRWPRSDLNAWIKVLNKFDAILEEVIRDYDIDKLQVNVLTPLTKKTICEILRFERMLLENSTNRKTFNSYDRLNSLMFASDLDVLIHALNLLLRPAQQYSAQPSVTSALSISTSRLSSLAKRWPNLREYDISLLDLVNESGKTSLDALPNEAREVNFVFYRQNKSDSNSSGGKANAPEPDVFDSVIQTPARKAGLPNATASTSGAVTIHIDNKTIESKDAMDILADVVEAYSVPDSEKFELLTRIRAAQAVCSSKKLEREKLVLIRLLATAIFGHTHSETQAQSTLFMYEPELIAHIAELLQLDREISLPIQTAAIYALDALGRYRGKIQDVLSAVNAGVNHGVLMALLRKTVADVAQPSSTLPQSFVEALLSFVTFIATHASGGNMVVSAGLVPVLIQIIENRLPNRLYLVSKTMQLLDNVLYGFNNAFQLFCNAHGVDLLVARIEHEVDIDLAEHANLPQPQEIVPYGKISVGRTAVLKHVLRSMHRMMQSSGTAEGLRGLLDSSLLKSIKKILQHRHIFGPSVIPIAINIMATFVHNEPTCLPVIQEAGLPEAFYSLVEAGLEPIIEVIQAVPNAIGALCLNQAGQDQLTARPSIIPGLFSIFTSERHQRVLQDKENAVLIGTSIEELIRHHPSLKTPVFTTIKATLARIEELGNAYEPPESIRSWYQLTSETSSLAPPTTTDGDVIMEATERDPTSQVAGAASENEPTVASDFFGFTRDDTSTRAHDNLIISFIDVFCKFLEGFFQHAPHCKEFIADTAALEHLGNITALPCLPYDFSNSVASDSLVQVIRTMAEAATTETLSFLLKLVQDSLATNAEFWDDVQEQSKLLSMVDVKGEEAVANIRFRKLVTLNTRISLLSDIYTTAGYSHGRANLTLLQSLAEETSKTMLAQLGSLHRACVWENIALKTGLASQGLEGLVPPSTSSQLDDTPSIAPPNIPDASPSLSHSGSNPANGVQSEVPSPPEQQAPSKEDSPKERNAKAVKHLASQIPSSLAPFFQSVVRLFQPRRSIEGPHKQKIREVSAVLAEIIVKHLEPKNFGDKLSLLAYYTVMLGLVTVLLIDERSNQKILHTVLLVAFDHVNGIEAILDLCRSFVNTIEAVTKVSFDDRSDISKQELVHAYGGLKVALHLLHPIISAKPLFDSPQTPLITTTDKKPTDPIYFEPRNFLVRSRLTVLPLLLELWEAPWLISAPLSVSKSVVHTVMEILSTEGEEAKEQPSLGTVPSTLAMGGITLSRAIGPDENRIRQLVDMGFPRSAAERALVRTRNNINAATELLLAHPFPLPPDPEPPVPPQDPVAPTTQATTPPAPPAAEAPAGEASSTSEGDAFPAPEGEASSAPVTANDTAMVLDEGSHEDEPVKTSEDWLNELNSAREPLKEGLGPQALKLADEHPSLVFDVQKVFVGPSGGFRDRAARCLVDDVKAFSPSAYDVHEQPLAVRCRLLALALNEPSSPLAQMKESDAKGLMDVLLALLLANPRSSDGTQPTIPKWLAAHMLVVEALLMMGEEPRDVTLPNEGDPVDPQPIAKGPLYAEARSILFEFCLRLLAIPSLPKDELLSTLRLLVFVTRERKFADDFVRHGGVALLLHFMKSSKSTSNFGGAQSYIIIILRHIVEGTQILRQIMRQEIKRWFSHPRNHMVDVGTFVNGCSALALRDPEVFIQVTEDSCQMSSSAIKTVSLKQDPKSEDTSPPKSAEKADVEMQVDDPPVDASNKSEASWESLVHFLVAELVQTVRAENLSDVPPVANTTNTVALATSTGSANQETSEPSRDAPADRIDHNYACFLMQCLAELLFSYESCKTAFLSYSPRKRIQTPAKEASKHRTAAIQFLLQDLMSFGTLDPQPSPEAKKQIVLCNWAMSVVVALCVDPSSGQDTKEVTSDLTSVRKFVLEAISRALKDLPSHDNPENRYGRLLALADLCHRLLTVRFNVAQRKATDEFPSHIAKVMLEKNFVATLTNAVGEIDLNYPHVRSVVTAVLKPLDYLTKVAIKMSRLSDKNKDLVADPESATSVASDEDEDAVDAEREETPDLYRNSSLGLFGGEMEDVHYGHDDDMDEDEDEEEDDVEMDFGDETGSEDTSNTDEDAEDDLDDLENETDESEEGWQDEEEEEEDLVANDGEDEDDEDDDEEGDADDDADGDEMMWQDIAVGEDLGEVAEEADDEEEDEGREIPIMAIMPPEAGEEGDLISEGDEYDDEYGPLDGGHGAADVFGIAHNFANAFANVLQTGGQPTFWSRAVRSDRRRGIVEDDFDMFGPPRNPPSSAEATTHPLLLDPAASPARALMPTSRITRRIPRNIVSGNAHDLLSTIEDVLGEEAAQLLHQVVTQGRGGNAESIRIDVPHSALAPLQRHARGAISASIRLERAPRNGEGRIDGQLEPMFTVQRWAEEVRMLHGKFESRRLSKLANHVTLALLPAAMEAAKQAKIAEADALAKQKELQAKADEAATKAKAELSVLETDEGPSAEQTDIEENPGASVAPSALDVTHNEDHRESDMQEADAIMTGQSEASSALEVSTSEATQNTHRESTEEEPDSTEENAANASSSNVTERITVTIHGNPVDITDTGIDPTFLEALPDDMREEVLNQHVREQRAARVERPVDSQISPEFLDALPPDIRAEIIQQETVERARHRVDPAQQTGTPVPADIDPASFIASLDPQLRQVVLMDSDDMFIQSLPSHMIAEATIHRESGRPPRVPVTSALLPSAPPQHAQKASASRDAIQLLDKQAVAILARLLFFPSVTRKNLLFKVLLNLCENSKTRTDLFNLLLNILQDGSGDLASIDRSFAQMSFRSAKPQAQQTPKSLGKQRVPADYFGAISLPHWQNEVVPELIVQRCLEALTYIVSSNELSSLFFLTEHELPAGLRRGVSKKGKGKEKQVPQTHYPVVLLLSLLDRPPILKASSIVESVVALLATVTRPLANLKDAKKRDEELTSNTAPSASSEAPAPISVAAGATQTAPPLDPPALVESTQPIPENTAPAPTIETKILLANPPAIPHPVLRLIVNILTAGECSGRTFSQSLALIQHLSYIPDARDVVAAELRSRAHDFGQTLHDSLDELATALNQSQGDVLASSVALKFSPASSDQAKLLRVLKTIDYMYSPRSTAQSPAEVGDSDIEKVQSIYEAFRFTPLWQRLGDCLSIIEEKPETEHIATVLLPLIESLMVVCKYAGSKTISGAAGRALRASASPRTPTTPRESMEDLFVAFTDAHRKVLNLMVRNNPSLMSGSFSLLVHNPRVLDFDNKRNYFNQQLHRRPHAREHHGTLQLNVRRQRVFEDSFQYLQRKTGDQIKYGKLSVRFYDEEGVDAGGVTREWFQILARQMFDPNYALFQPCAADRLTYQPNRASWVNPEHLSFFKFVGRIIGKAIYDGRLLDAYFAKSLYRQLLGKPVDYRDVEWVDPEYYNSLCWILNNDPSALELTFSVEADEFGVTKIVDLKENGAHIPVTQENKREFVQLSAQYRLYSSIKDQIESLLGGFYEIIPKDLISIFNEQELELLISGTPDIDVDEWRSATEYNGYTSSDPVVVWWWRALKSFNRDERAKVLSFATGTSRVPLGGFNELQGVQGVQRFSIHRAYGDTDRLPQAHTCFNQIDLPQYSSYEMLRQQLLLAILEGGEGFGFA